MKKNLGIILFLSFFIVNINAQEVPNGNFEEWESFQGQNFEFPSGWISSNFSGVPSGIEANAIKTTDAYQGTYAIKLTTVNGLEPSEPHVGVALYDGAIDKTPHALQGYYKTSLVGNDVPYISIDVLSGGSFIGGAVIEFESSQSDYTYFSLPIDYIVESPNADRFFLSILSSIEDGVVGSTLTVDALSFDGSTAVSDYDNPKTTMLLSPNPTSETLNITISDFSDDVDMIIYDINGKVITTRHFSKQFTLDVIQYQIGQYFIELRNKNKSLIQSSSFVISR